MRTMKRTIAPAAKRPVGSSPTGLSRACCATTGLGTWMSFDPCVSKSFLRLDPLLVVPDQVAVAITLLLLDARVRAVQVLQKRPAACRGCQIAFLLLILGFGRRLGRF